MAPKPYTGKYGPYRNPLFINSLSIIKQNSSSYMNPAIAPIKNIKTIEENDTVGIIICKQDNEYVIKYCSDDRIIAREYELV